MEYLITIKEQAEFFFEYMKPSLEIGILTILIYYILYFLRGTRGFFVLAGIIISLSILTLTSSLLTLEVITWLLESLWGFLVVALIVIFQPELRRGFALLGSGSAQFSSKKQRKQEVLNELVHALTNMSKNKIGALIVFEGKIGIQSIINDAVHIDATLNKHIIESIFYPNSPLHDGAIIVRNNKIVAAHAILPLSNDKNLNSSIGTRHRAAIGITEETDAVAVIVSEETGKISIASNKEFKQDISYDKILSELIEKLEATEEEPESIKTFISDISESKDNNIELMEDENEE